MIIYTCTDTNGSHTLANNNILSLSRGISLVRSATVGKPEKGARRVQQAMSSSVAGVFNNILEAIGSTPMVRLDRLNPNPKCELFGKVELTNPGGSVKDRIAVRMILKAQERGEIKPGDTLIEATSGNTGIGLAMAGAVLGYHVIIVMPEKMSLEKQRTMEVLGAQIIRTPTEAPHDSPESNFGVAARLHRHLPNSHILAQFENPENPAAHYETTAEEILEQMGGKLDVFVAGAGTGGTLTGIAHRLKEVIPNVKVVGADPIGSTLSGGSENAAYAVEGIGYDFTPTTMDLSAVDRWERVGDGETFKYALEIIRKEGILVGGSSGTAMAAALRVAKECQNGERICVLLPDSIRNYMGKFVSNHWLTDHGFEPYEKSQYVDWEAIRDHV